MSICSDIQEKYQVRKTLSQKTAFIGYMQQAIPGLQVEKLGLMGSRNLIYGDVSRAKVIFTAHYDTVSRSYLPNLVTPDRQWLKFITLLLMLAPIIAAMIACGVLLEHFGVPYKIKVGILLAIYWAGFLGMFFLGKPNPHTANDNTSGVLTLIRLIEEMPESLRDKAAFVFFDNEEYGCIGSGAFRRKHRSETTDKLVFNMDCVGDGNNILLIATKKAREQYESALRAAFLPDNGITPIITDAKKVRYASDQKHFPVSVAAAAMKRGKWLGLYLDRIHTVRDTVCNAENIDYLTAGSISMLRDI